MSSCGGERKRTLVWKPGQAFKRKERLYVAVWRVSQMTDPFTTIQLWFLTKQLGEVCSASLKKCQEDTQIYRAASGGGKIKHVVDFQQVFSSMPVAWCFEDNIKLCNWRIGGGRRSKELIRQQYMLHLNRAKCHHHAKFPNCLWSTVAKYL